MRRRLRCVLGALVVVVGSLWCLHAHGEERADSYLHAMENARALAEPDCVDALFGADPVMAGAALERVMTDGPFLEAHVGEIVQRVISYSTPREPLFAFDIRVEHLSRPDYRRERRCQILYGLMLGIGGMPEGWMRSEIWSTIRLRITEIVPLLTIEQGKALERAFQRQTAKFENNEERAPLQALRQMDRENQLRAVAFWKDESRSAPRSYDEVNEASRCAVAAVYELLRTPEDRRRNVLAVFQALGASDEKAIRSTSHILKLAKYQAGPGEKEYFDEAVFELLERELRRAPLNELDAYLSLARDVVVGYGVDWTYEAGGIRVTAELHNVPLELYPENPKSSGGNSVNPDAPLQIASMEQLLAYSSPNGGARFVSIVMDALRVRPEMAVKEKLIRATQNIYPRDPAIAILVRDTLLEIGADYNALVRRSVSLEPRKFALESPEDEQFFRSGGMVAFYVEDRIENIETHLEHWKRVAAALRAP